MKSWGLVRVSEDFRVIALGLPVPRYRGVPLDPPLRSRFQARDICNLTYQVNSFNQKHLFTSTIEATYLLSLFSIYIYTRIFVHNAYINLIGNITLGLNLYQ